MPRRAREKSNSGIYHIFLRGINRQNIFEDREDNQKFLYTLQRYKEISAYSLYAYCLMGNHVHLLLQVGVEPMAQFMRRICGSYVYWYNKKYERIGNLFQDRFKSEPVEDDAYFLTVLRYIHQNPCKAGMVKELGHYNWSSYGSYIDENKNKLNLVDVGFALKVYDEDIIKAVHYFKEHHNKEIIDACLDMDERFCISDQEAGKIIQPLYKIKNGFELQKMEKTQRNNYLKKLKDEYNISIRQTAILTGINRGIVCRA